MNDGAKILLKLLLPLLLILGPFTIGVTVYGYFSKWPGLDEERTSIVLIDILAAVGTIFSYRYCVKEYGWFQKR